MDHGPRQVKTSDERQGGGGVIGITRKREEGKGRLVETRTSIITGEGRVSFRESHGKSSLGNDRDGRGHGKWSPRGAKVEGSWHAKDTQAKKELWGACAHPTGRVVFKVKSTGWEWRTDSVPPPGGGTTGGDSGMSSHRKRSGEKGTEKSPEVEIT